MKNLIYLFGLVLCCSFISCTADPCDDEEQAEADSNALLDAAIDYSFNPSTVNCEEFRDILEDYLDTYENCDGVNPASIAESRQTLAGLPCR